MKNYNHKLFIALLALFGLAVYYPVNSSGSDIVRINGKLVTMENDLGCKLDFYYENGKYGLGTFYFRETALGEPIRHFITEDNIWENSANKYQTIWPVPWTPHFQADRFEVLKNTSDTGIVKFTGRIGKVAGSVTVTLTGSSAAYKLDYDINVIENIKHPLYISGPFKNENMMFVQFPFENPLTPPFAGQWSITPTLSMVPLMFGCERINQKDFYVGIGYQLEKDPYERGKLLYDSGSKTPFRLYFISPDNTGWFGTGKLSLHAVITTASNQYDAVSGYRAVSGYDVSTPLRRTVAEAVKGVMEMYKNTTAYVSLPPYKNKAYHHQINPNSGAPPLYGYGEWINIGINAQLGYQLYKYWQGHPSETWAKERALNLAGFYMEVQKKDGSVPSLWDPKTKEFRTYKQYLTDSGYIYCMDRQALGASSLYKLYLARREYENVSAEELKQSALKAMDYIAGKVKKDGILGRNYNAKGKYDMVPAPNEALIALDYFYSQTGDKKYDEAREILEKFTYETHVFRNHWYDWSSDFGGWNGEGAPPINNDALNLLSFATYCAYRHMQTGDQKYIDWAKHVISYNWLVTIPIQFPGFRNVTKGLTREQDHYLTYDIPFRTTLVFDCYPYLSMITGDRFFIDFYKMLIQTQHYYQSGKGLQSFNIGLWWDATGANPRDEIGEPDVNYIVEFCSMYLESVTSPNAYRYVGGPDWGVGLDYSLSFTPGSGEEDPYIAAASSTVNDVSWDTKEKALTVSLKGKIGEKGTLNIGTMSGKNLSQSFKITVNGKPADKNSVIYNSSLNLLVLKYSHNQEILTVQIAGK